MFEKGFYMFFDDESEVDYVVYFRGFFSGFRSLVYCFVRVVVL